MTAQDFLSDREEVKNFMFRLFLLGRQVYLKYSMDEMSVYAAQASFFIIMAAFPFFMVLLALIQTAPMIHEADLLRFLLPAIPDRFRGLFLYLLDTLHSDSPAALISVTAVAAVWSASKGMLWNRERVKQGIRRYIPTKLYSSQSPLQRLHSGIFPYVRSEPRAPCVRKFSAENAVKMDPCPVIPVRDALPLPWTRDVYHADDFFYCPLHSSPASETFTLRSDSRSDVLRCGMGTHISGIFRLFPLLRLIRRHIREPDCSDPFYAVALCLDLYPVCGSGDQLVFTVL